MRDHAHDQILKVFIRDVGANQSVADLEIRARKRVSAVSVQSTSTTGSIRTWMGFSSTTAVTEQLSINDADTHKRWRLFKDPTEIILDSDVREYLTTQYRGDLQAAAANFDEESEEDVVPIVVNSVDRPVHVVVNDTKVAETVLANVVSEAFELQEETIELGEPSNTETVPALDEMNLEEIMGEIAELKGH